MKKRQIWPWNKLIVILIAVAFVTVVGVNKLRPRTMITQPTLDENEKMNLASSWESQRKKFHENPRALTDEQFQQIALEVEQEKQGMYEIENRPREFTDATSAETRVVQWQEEVDELKEGYSKLSNKVSKKDPRSVASQIKRQLKNLNEDAPPSGN